MSNENRYYLTSDGELCHAIGDWKKKNAKYVKREWKNGRWVYTYPEDKNSPKNKLKTASNNVKNTVNKAKKAVNDATGITAAKRYKALSNYASVVSKSKKGNDSTVAGESRVSKANQAKEAARKELMNTPIGKIQSATGDLKKKITKGANKVKDWAGVDEKYALDKETKNLQGAKERYSKAVDRDGHLNSKDSRREKTAAKYGVKAAEEKWHDANAAFLQTPIGKLTTAKEIGSKWLDSAVKAAGKAKDAVSDAIEKNAEKKAAEKRAMEEKEAAARRAVATQKRLAAEKQAAQIKESVAKASEKYQKHMAENKRITEEKEREERIAEAKARAERATKAASERFIEEAYRAAEEREHAKKVYNKHLEEARKKRLEEERERRKGVSKK